MPSLDTCLSREGKNADDKQIINWSFEYIWQNIELVIKMHDSLKLAVAERL
jgi:hypothetical protein